MHHLCTCIHELFILPSLHLFLYVPLSNMTCDLVCVLESCWNMTASSALPYFSDHLREMIANVLTPCNNLMLSCAEEGHTCMMLWLQMTTIMQMQMYQAGSNRATSQQWMNVVTNKWENACIAGTYVMGVCGSSWLTNTITRSPPAYSDVSNLPTLVPSPQMHVVLPVLCNGQYAINNWWGDRHWTIGN